MKVLVKFFDHDLYAGDNKLIAPDRKHNWVDLRAAEDVILHPGDFTLIRLGVAMKLPYGYEAHLAPRSSTFKSWNILQANSFGVIDESFCGEGDEWRLPVYFPHTCGVEEVHIKRGDRICQFRIIERQPQFEFEVVEHLDMQDRGGFGSTGLS